MDWLTRGGVLSVPFQLLLPRVFFFFFFNPGFGIMLFFRQPVTRQKCLIVRLSGVGGAGPAAWSFLSPTLEE